MRRAIASLALLALAGCRDPGPPPEETAAVVPSAPIEAPAVATPSATTTAGDVAVRAFGMVDLVVRGALRGQDTTPVDGGLRHVVRIEHRYASSEEALADVERQLQAAGWQVTRADAGVAARVHSPDGRAGSVEVVDAAATTLTLASPDATGMLSLYWIEPAPAP